MSLSQTLSAVGASAVYLLAPRQSATYLASTSDLDNATVHVQVSRNFGQTWEQLAELVGSGGEETVSGAIRNEETADKWYRFLAVETAESFTGEAAVSFTDANDLLVEIKDPVTGRVIMQLRDNGSVFPDDLEVDGEAALDGEATLGGNTLEVEAGVGVTGAAGAVYASGVERVGGLIRTTILLDLTDLDSSGTDGDIIGKSTGGAAHLGQITAARNGTILFGTIRCLEVPTGGDPDVDFWAADEATGAFDALISGLTNEAQLINTGDWTLEEDTLTVLPGDGQYLYAVAGSTDDATYTAGKFLITLYGV